MVLLYRFCICLHLLKSEDLTNFNGNFKQGQSSYTNYSVKKFGIKYWIIELYSNTYEGCLIWLPLDFNILSETKSCFLFSISTSMNAGRLEFSSFHTYPIMLSSEQPHAWGGRGAWSVNAGSAVSPRPLQRFSWSYKSWSRAQRACGWDTGWSPSHWCQPREPHPPQNATEQTCHMKRSVWWLILQLHT